MKIERRKKEKKISLKRSCEDCKGKERDKKIMHIKILFKNDYLTRRPIETCVSVVTFEIVEVIFLKTVKNTFQECA